MTGLRDVALAATIAALAGLPAMARGQVNLILEGGYFSGDKVVLEGFPQSRLDSAPQVGARLGYVIPLGGGNGLGIDLGGRRFATHLRVGNDDFGTLTATPITLRVSHAYRPPSGRGLGGHIGLGAGFAFSSFTKGPFLLAAEGAGSSIVVKNERSGVSFETPVGLDYFLARWISIGAEARLLVMRIGTDWKVDGTSHFPGYPGHDVIQNFWIGELEFAATVRFWIPGT